MKVICLLVILVAPALARADVVFDWNNVALDVIQRTSTPPPVAAWALAMTHVAVYDSVNSIEPTHRPFRVYVPESPATSREAAAARAAFRVLVQLYPAERSRLEDSLVKSLAQIDDGPEKTAGIRLGDIVAERILAWRSEDGSQRVIVHPAGAQPGQWRPTPPDYRPALMPQWAFVTPFGIAYGSQFRPAFPPPLDSAEYTRDFQEVKRLGAVNSSVRTDEQTRVAHFWADGPDTVTPPGHWNRIGQTVAQERRLSVHENARLFALLNVSLADAAIVCWDMKYACNLWRPITAIHEADNDGNNHTKSDPQWRPLLDTPPFPSCTSGHSTFSGAAAQVLALFFGQDHIRFRDTSGGRGITRTFASFSQAADEAGRSRIYGGIHFELDNRAGLQSGSAVGRYIFDYYLGPLSMPIGGSAATQTAYRPASNEVGTASGEPSVAQCVAVPVLCYAADIFAYYPDVIVTQAMLPDYVGSGW